MKLVGYTDRWSAEAGETVRFYVSATTPRYRAELVRIIHGDENPAGPGYKEEAVEHEIAGEYAGAEQRIHPGSYAIVEPFPRSPPLRCARGCVRRGSRPGCRASSRDGRPGMRPASAFASAPTARSN